MHCAAAHAVIARTHGTAARLAANAAMLREGRARERKKRRKKHCSGHHSHSLPKSRREILHDQAVGSLALKTTNPD
jgi:hypothetical protein